MTLRLDFFVACILFLAVLAWAKSVQSSDTNATDAFCDCFYEKCSCCDYLDWDDVEINGPLCSVVSYLNADNAINVITIYDRHTITNKTISEVNPPPICGAIPESEKVRAEMCVSFYDLSPTHYHGCVNLNVTVDRTIHKSAHLGCWDGPIRFHPLFT